MLDEKQQKLLGALPETARRRFLIAQREADALAAAGREYEDRRRELRSAIRDEEWRIEYSLQKARVPANDPSIVVSRESIALKRAEVREIEQAGTERNSRRRELTLLTTAALDLVGSVVRSGKTLIALPDAKFTPRRGEDFAVAVERCRRKVSECKAKIAEIADAPLPAELAKAAMRAEIAAIAAIGKPDVQPLFSGGSVEWQAADAVRDAGLKLVIWLHRSAIVQALEAEIDATANDDKALRPEERIDLTKKAEAAQLDAEREECGLIEAAAAAGMKIAHRSDVSIIAWLGVDAKFGTAPKKDTTPRYGVAMERTERDFAMAPRHGGSLMPFEPALRSDPV